MDDGIKKSIKDAEKCIDNLKNYQSPALVVDDITEDIVPHLDSIVKEALTKPVYQTIVLGVYEVRYVGIKRSSLQGKKAGKELAEAVNKLCKKYTPIGVLGTPIKYDLYTDPFKEPQAIYLLYLAFSPEDASEIPQKNNQ